MSTRAALLCAAGMSALWATGALAQTTPPAKPPVKEVPPVPAGTPTATAPSNPTQEPGEKAPGAAEDEGIVVTGFRASLEQSIDLKRDAIAIRDSIVAEDIGKFPEANIADALQRIPGVELVRDGNSNEGQTIQLRGLGSQFTITTFNGSPVYTTSSGGVGNASRNFNYDVFPSELFGRADVYKSPLAELTEGGIAGVVDLQTPRPFDRPGRQIRYAVSANHNSQTGFISPRGHVLFSNTWGNFGVLLSVAAAETKNGRSGFQSTGSYSGARLGTIPGASFGNNFDYNFAAPGVNLNGATEAQIRDAILPRFFIVQVGANLRKRLGASGSLQYRNDRLNISLDGLYSKVKDSNENKDIRFPMRDSVGALSLVPLNVRVDENNNLQGTLGNVQFNYANFFDNSETEYMYGALNVAYELTDTFRVSAQAAYSDSQAFRNNITLSGDARQLRHEITFDTTDPVFPTLSTNRDLLDPATYVTNAGPSYGGGYREEEDKLKAGRLVFDWDYGMGGLEGHLKLGASINENTKVLDTRATNNLYNGLTIPNVGPYSSATLAQRNAFIVGFLKPFNTTEFVPGGPSSLPTDFLAFNREFAYGTLDAVNTNRMAPNNFGQTYEAIETIKAAFVQSDFDTDLFGRRLRMNAGVRFVDTKSDIDNFNLVNGTFLPNSRKGGYSTWLPSFTIAYDIVPDVVLRGSVGRTFTRSAIQSIAASISLPAGGAGNLLLNAGNPDLRPEFATGYDAAAEWYFAKGGILSVAFYKKEISGRASTSSQFLPFNSLGIPSSIFTVNIQNDLAANPAMLVEVRTPVNLNDFSLTGFEAAYQQNFTFLPEPFDGLGALASFTNVKTSGLTRTILGQPYKLNEVPKRTYQIAAFYEKGPFATRVSYNYKSEVANVGQTSGNAIGFQRYANARGYLDANVSYKFAPWIELRVDAANILETRTYDFFRHVQGLYGDEESRVEGANVNGRVITVGIRGKF